MRCCSEHEPPNLLHDKRTGSRLGGPGHGLHPQLEARTADGLQARAVCSTSLCGDGYTWLARGVARLRAAAQGSRASNRRTS